jgi:predicted transcriptional regulator
MDVATQLFATRGAVTAVAARLGISQAAVSQWRERGIPSGRTADVEEALREHLRSLGMLAEASDE